MGTMTITVGDETEKKFREFVRSKYGTGKGKLGKAIDEALNKLISEDEERKLREEAIRMMEKGLYKVGKNYTFRREEAYENRTRKILGTG